MTATASYGARATASWQSLWPRRPSCAGSWWTPAPKRSPSCVPSSPGWASTASALPSTSPGPGNWPHEHGDAANTRVARDQLVKAPLGLLWFGGPSHEGILPRHGHGPQPQVIDGRCIIEGVDMLRAIDIYTGRLLWETQLPGIGFFYNNLLHHPGANASGGHYVCTSDSIDAEVGPCCFKLDPRPG